MLLEYEHEELPQPGDRLAVVDSDGLPVAVIELTEVRLVPVGEIDLPFAREEGEGFESVADWRAAHEAFWSSAPFRASIERPDFAVGEETLVVAQRFRLARVQRPGVALDVKF